MMSAQVQRAKPEARDDDLLELMKVIRRALLMVVRWIETRYGIAD